MGVTRKERFLKAMLNDNAEACRGGVTREERLLASVSKKVCDNDALEGGGTGGGGSGGGVLYVDITQVTQDQAESSMSFDELMTAYNNNQLIIARMTYPGQGDILLPLANVSDSVIAFVVYASGTTMNIAIMADGNVKVIQS